MANERLERIRQMGQSAAEERAAFKRDWPSVLDRVKDDLQGIADECGAAGCSAIVAPVDMKSDTPSGFEIEFRVMAGGMKFENPCSLAVTPLHDSNRFLAKGARSGQTILRSAQVDSERLWELVLDELERGIREEMLIDY